jgi:hypothetical protein
MLDRTSKELFDLVKSMSKTEKKSFNSYVKRSTNSESLKVLKVYNAINSMKYFDENILARKMKGLQCRQLPAIRIFLYKQLLDSLRLSRKEESILLQLHQLMDHVNIFDSKRFIVQALRVLCRVKNIAKQYHQLSFQFQALAMEKKIELIFGTGDEKKINELNAEMQACNEQLVLTGHLSTQSMLLYSWYKNYGVVTSADSRIKAVGIFKACSEIENDNLSFYPRLHLLQAKTYYYLLTQQKENFYQAASDWVNLFAQNTRMKEVELMQFYISVYYLNEAAFKTSNQAALINTGEILNQSGDPFHNLSSGLNLSLSKNLPAESLLDKTYSYIKASRNPDTVLNLCYKTAQLCLNQKNYERALDFTIIALNLKAATRVDLQYKIRQLHLESHQKLGNSELTPYLELSVRRFRNSHKQVPVS